MVEKTGAKEIVWINSNDVFETVKSEYDLKKNLEKN